MVSVGPTLVLRRPDHDSCGLRCGVGLNGNDRLWEVDREASFLEAVSGVRSDTNLHPVNLVAEVVDLELEVLVGLRHELNEGLNGFDLDDAELHDVDQSVHLRRSLVGRWEIVQFLNLCRDGQLSRLHLHVGVSTDDDLEVDFLSSTDIHVSGSSGGKSIARDLDGDLFDVGRWIGDGAGCIARQGRTWLNFDLNLTWSTGH